MTRNNPRSTPAPRRAGFLIVLALLATFFFTVFCALGVWQIQRRAWKLDLIAQVSERVHRPAAPAPGPAQWTGLSKASDEYRHIQATGLLRPDLATLVQAATELGSGYWVLTPMELSGGGTVLVNRGFVLPEWRKRQPEPPVQASVTGLLRMSEPGGGFLRSNDPAQGLWYSRDTQAIGTARGLAGVAPYFIDAEREPGGARPDPAIAPVPGLTVLDFPNNHLSYALTWFALAAMSLAGAVIVARDERRRRRPAGKLRAD